MEPFVRMLGISKRFGTVQALDQVSIDVCPGETLGLMGENGAGKTTLMKILYGLYQPDEGEIVVGRERAEIRSPHDAIRLGLGMVHQHFMLVRTFTVRENLALGLNINRSPFLDIEAVEAQINQLATTYGIEIDAREQVHQLSVGEQQRVEILNALLRDTRVLILDEPTAVLTPQETDALFATLRTLTAQGHSVIFITHKLEEVKRITDRIAVLRQGHLVGTRKTDETTERELANLMVGREVFFSYERNPRKVRGEAISINDLWVKNDRGLWAIEGVSFGIGGGEILGIAGVDGNGQRELCEALAGVRKIEAGDMEINDRCYSDLTSREARKMGIGYIPEDRQRTGLVLGFPLWRNSILKRYADSEFVALIVMRVKRIIDFAQKLIAQYDIRAPNATTLTQTLSGGNQQKIVLARELSAEPSILIANQPTRGLDIGATEYVHSMLLEQRDAGKAVLLVSRELSEVLTLSDRIAVMYEGHILEIVSREEANPERIGQLMAGYRDNG